VEFKSKNRVATSGPIDQCRVLSNTEEKSIMNPTLKEIAATPTATDPRWQRVLARDKGADGLFWYSVATTGVYCRPSCASRTAHPKNVKFHDTVSDAQCIGFRACKRCNPDGLSLDAANAAVVAKACRLIEQSETVPSLAELAEATELSPGYFHRLFKSTTGVTPKGYAAAHRADRVRAALGGGGKVTDAIYDAGFKSSGRFYEQAAGILGMTPTQYKAGGAGEEIRFAVAECSLGSILVASSEVGVVSILLGDDASALAEDLQDRFLNARLVGGDADYDRFVAHVIGRVEAPGVGLDLPLDVRGTAFQQRVWQALRAIPAGQTASYRDIAERIGARSAVRAVAGACAANNIAIAIPCHRVVRTDGSLSGYAWGVERKRVLLEREDAA
jgi:AraC family transcriptional regulator, regulatory protein of adaptative response / methylated-DNA-[protein]-cysteine methyltransferase